MRKFGKKLLVFFIFLISGYCIFLCVFSTKFFRDKIPNIVNRTDGFTLQMFRELDTLKKTDILFMGSSHCYTSIDPAVFRKENINTFNIATAGQRPVNMYCLLQQYLKKISFKTIVLEVYWETFNEELLNEATLYIISNHDMNLDFFEMGLYSKDLTLLNSMLAMMLYRLHNPLAEEKVLSRKNYNYVKGGFIGMPQDTNLLAEIPFFKPISKGYSDQQFHYLIKILELLKTAHYQPVLLMAPTVPEYKNICVDYTFITHKIDSISKVYHLVFLNYNDKAKYMETGLNIKDDFKDKSHLAATGAKKFSKVVLKDLKQLKVIQW